MYTTSDGTTAVVCAVSREHRTAAKSYWFAFHPHQQTRLRDADRGFVAFGCGSERVVVLIPYADFEPWIEGLNVTQLPDRMYWHVSIFREGAKLVLHRKKGFDKVDLTRFLLKA